MSNGFSPSKNWRERGYRRPGPKSGYAARVIMNRFGVGDRVVKTVGVKNIVRCKDNAAIRILLGISIKAKRGEKWPIPNLHLNKFRNYMPEWA